MQKTYVLDSNIILHEAESIFKFEEHTVIIPQTVIQEIDKFKKDQNEIGRNARAFTRYMDELRKTGTLVDGLKGQGGVVANEQGGIIKVKKYSGKLAKKWLPDEDLSIFDNRILACALQLQSEFDNVTVVSNDGNMRLLADIWGLEADVYLNDKIQTDDMYTGVHKIVVPTALINKVYDDGKLFLPELDLGITPYPNECFVLHGDCNLKQSALVRYNSVMKTMNLLPQDMKTVDIMPRNTEQQFLLDILKDPEVSLVTVNGKAGSGKTLIALASAIYGVLETQQYAKILLLKPIVNMDNGHDIGFLPGTMEEKLAPWMASYSDNIEVIMAGYLKEEVSPHKTSRKNKTKKEMEAAFEKQEAKIHPLQELMALGLVEMGNLQNIRGRSLPRQYIIIDEGQNLTKKAIKTVITRAGEGTKIIILGDTSQIDSPYLDSSSNALAIVAEAFKFSDISAHITLKKSERSKLAELATNIL